MRGGEVHLTDAERAQWDLDPDQWPHTPPLHVFRALMDEDDNTWWRAGSGHGLNAYDAAIERIEELEARAAEVAAVEARVRREAAALADRWEADLSRYSDVVARLAIAGCADDLRQEVAALSSVDGVGS